MDGLEIVDKPLKKTSFDMVREARKKYNIKKVGHIGTLDPMATGVLVILVGEATKLSDYLMEHDKEYIAKISLGKKTETGDSEGNVIEEKEVPTLDREKIEKVLKSFLGQSNQVPPMYSAVKVDGEKLYNLARKGINVERKSRKIEITEIELLDFSKNEITFRVVCSKGTYIRVLCEDIAEKLETCGYMKELRRTRIGKFKVEDAGKFIELKDIIDNCVEAKNNAIIDKSNEVKNKAITDNSVEIQNEDVKKLLNGVKIKVDKKDGLVNIYNNNNFLGIGQIEKGMLKRKIIVA